MNAEFVVSVWSNAVTTALYGYDGRHVWERVFRGRGAVGRAVADMAACRTLDSGTVRVFWRETGDSLSSGVRHRRRTLRDLSNSSVMAVCGPGSTGARHDR